MGSPRNVCHRCRHKWKVKGWAEECPKCGHSNVGPTDPAPGILAPLLIGLAVLGGAAWVLGFIPDEAKDAVESTVEDVRQEVEKHVPRDEETPKPPPTQPRKTTSQAGQPKPVTPPARSAEPEESEIKVPLPRVEVASKSGAATSNTYFVTGKVENTGGADASGVTVKVTFKDASGSTVSVVEARCPSDVAKGERVKFEAAVAGAEAKRVETFTVDVDWKVF